MKSRRRQLVYKVILLLFLFIVSVPSVAAQFDQYGRFENGVSENWFMESKAYSKEEAATAQARWKAIEADVKAGGGHLWAGDYFIGGETHGSFLRWSQQSGFVLMHIDKCAASVMDFSYGKVVVTPDLIVFTPERAAKQSSPHGGSHSMALKYVPALWRGAHYLVDEARMADFGDYVAGLGEFNVGLNPGLWAEMAHFFYKNGDMEDELDEEAPVVPAGYKRFIKRPVEGSITAVVSRSIKREVASDGEPSYESRTIVTINVGRADGLKVGMTLRMRESQIRETVRIVRVRRNSSVGEIIRDVDDNKNEVYYEWRGEEQRARALPAVTAGWRVTTL